MCIIPPNPILGLYYFIHEICWYIIKLGWRHVNRFFFPLHPLLEVDRCRCPCGPSSCFKLPVVAVLRRRCSFPFCACYTFSRCLSPVWSFLASCLGNIHHFLMPFTSLYLGPTWYAFPVVGVFVSLRCFWKEFCFSPLQKKGEVFHHKQDILDPIKKSAMMRRKTKHAASFSENCYQLMAFVACLNGKNDQFEFEIVCFLIDGDEWDKYQFVPNSFKEIWSLILLSRCAIMSSQYIRSTHYLEIMWPFFFPEIFDTFS